MDQSGCYVYILLCENGAYYTGYTTNLARRLKEHAAGTLKCKFTRSFKPLRIVQCWRIAAGKSGAMQVERHIKTLSRQEKQNLIAFPEMLTHQFPCCHPAELMSGGKAPSSLF
ncbi:hypothetical protein AQUSIP_25240 [Aquicella siphonis]|uniref:GIY-YIG domain-containing protein n=1 Tax=Aquicella siphonis TaxID=254247 RepID=A0A5E4PLD8_9COXI|nr:GIY-YIG nuclease family protein [Aquicella siphonis]VVC77197.1 hypothetical protein AQUSIP_25240 [Aquicella siphonis]